MSRSYQVWQLSQHQEFLLQSVTREQVDGNSELDPKTGLPIGNDGTFEAGTAVGDNVDQRLDWNAGTQSHGYVQFRLQVEGAG